MYVAVVGVNDATEGRVVETTARLMIEYHVVVALQVSVLASRDNERNNNNKGFYQIYLSKVRIERVRASYRAMILDR
jgi:hypothetical protein